MLYCNLRVILENRNMTQRKVAKDTGLHENTIMRLCKNDFKMISIETASRLCDYLGITLDELFQKKNPE